MKQSIADLLQRFGDAVTLSHSGQTQTFRAFLRPVTSKSWQNMEHLFSELGRIEPGQYVYLGPAERTLAPGDELVCREAAYTVRKVESISAANRVLYRWALCVRKGWDDPWSS